MKPTSLISPSDIQNINTQSVPSINPSLAAQLAAIKAQVDLSAIQMGPEIAQARTLMNMAEVMVSRLPPGLGLLASTSHREGWNGETNEAYAFSIGAPIPIQSSRGVVHVPAIHGSQYYHNRGNTVKARFEEKNGRMYLYVHAS